MDIGEVEEGALIIEQIRGNPLVIGDLRDAMLKTRDA